MPDIVPQCPSCHSTLEATRLSCSSCEVALEGRFQLCPFCRMSTAQRDFALTFLRCRGNIKEVERELGISYPTVRGRLDEVLALLGPSSSSAAPAETTRLGVLQDLRDGKISHSQAMEALHRLNR